MKLIINKLRAEENLQHQALFDKGFDIHGQDGQHKAT